VKQLDGRWAAPLTHAQEAKRASLFSRKQSCPTTGVLMLGFEPLLAGTVFREQHPATSAANPDVITLCSRSCP